VSGASGFSGTTVPIGTYTFSFFAEGSAAITGLAVSITGGGAPTCTLNSTTVSASGFNEYYCTFTSTGSVVTAISITSTSNSKTLYIDSAQLMTGSTLSPYGDGTFQLRGIVDNPQTYQATSNSTTAFQVQNTGGTDMLNIDTLDSEVGVGTATPTSTLSVVGTASTSSSYALNVNASNGTGIVQVRDDGQVGLGEATSGGSYSTIGNTTSGSSVLSDNGQMVSNQYTTSSAVTITSMSVYVQNIQSGVNADYQVAIYTNSTTGSCSGTDPCPSTLVAKSGVGSLTAGWNTIAISASLSASTAYWLVFTNNATSSSNDNLIYNGTPATYSYAYGTYTFSTGGSLPSTFPWTATQYQSDGPLDIYATTNTGSSVGSALTINSSGDVGIGTTTPSSLLQVTTASNTTNALTIQNSSGVNVLNVDTSDGYVDIGTGTTATTTPALLVLGSGSSSTDPTEVNGAMYYNTSSNGFRCGHDNVWVNCDDLSFATTAQSTTSDDSTTEGGTNANFGQPYTIPANDCQAGVVYQVTASGYFEPSNSTSVYLILNLEDGTNNLLADGVAAGDHSVTLTGYTSNTPYEWILSATITCESTTSVMVASEVQFGTTGSNVDDTAMGAGLTSTLTWANNTTLQVEGWWSATNTNLLYMNQFNVVRMGPS
jgi:hypothetical protein